MTVLEAMEKYNKTAAETRIYSKALNTEVYRGYEFIKRLDSEVTRLYSHNGDMVCEVEV